MTGARPLTIPVLLGARSYDVLIGPGLLAQAAAVVGARLGHATCAIVTDRNVAAHHLSALQAPLAAAGRHAGTIVLEPGEAAKNFTELAALCERLLEMGLERGDMVLALGGGVIGDLAGFAASILRRGVRYVQLPTTLLAQVDSAVGGKTGINTPQGKNLVGTFHQPSLVLADTDTLATLPLREFRAGYAEVVKYAVIGDADFFARLERDWRSIFERDPAALTDVIATSVKAKAALVARDETEAGERMLLNFGHTFGHALEAWAGYSDKLLHGEAVALGMALAFRLSERLGFAPRGSAERVSTHLAAVGLPVHLDEIEGDERPEPAQLMKLMAQDKKVREGKFTLILTTGVGQAFVLPDVPADTISDFLTRELRGSVRGP
jgi:3-dehydroquinate synthase